MIDIKEKKNCCGCSACINVCPKKCISMKEDNEGFLYPFVDVDSCIQCGLCNKGCPIENVPIKDHGTERNAYILQHKEETICSQSTAGGAFSAIAEYVIDNGGVVFGVAFDDDFKVIHTYVESKDELSRFRNSKYVQSDVAMSFTLVKRFLMEQRLVCFSGTPCQIEGLRSFLKREYVNLILVDVVCRAVPSPGVWREYVKLLSGSTRNISSIRFRDKTLGYQCSTMEIMNDEGVISREGVESQTWLRMFFSGMIIRPSCTDCKFRDYHRNSDFTIWDCFNIHDIDASFNEDKGTTRVLVHTRKGMKLLDQFIDKVFLKQISIDIAVEKVNELVESPHFNRRRILFYEDYKTAGLQSAISTYYPVTAKVKIKKNLRLILNKFGMDKILKRIIRKLK